MTPQNNIKPILTFLLLAISMLMFTCATQNNLYQENDILESNPKIIFLNYSIEKRSSTNGSIQFISKKIVDGKFKNNNSQSIENGVIGDLICSQLDKKSRVIHRTLINNPLFKSVEYIDDSKGFHTKAITLDKTQFSVRLQLKTTTKYITISNFAKNKSLIKTKIN